MERCSARGDQPPAFAGGFPESVHAERIRENFDLLDFQLAADEMARLAVVDTVSPHDREAERPRPGGNGHDQVENRRQNPPPFPRGPNERDNVTENMIQSGVRYHHKINCKERLLWACLTF